MRKITTAITAAALALSVFSAAAVPAAAVTGYDSAYAGESAFVNITGGQTQNFQVFFANVGTTSWQKGTATQVDLAACLEDKVTCNAQDASEATWNSGWLSATRYATTTQTITPPGSLGTFSYNITAPVGVAAGIYHFNGDVVLASTGEKIHPEGYFQDANTGASAGAATITALTPNTGTSSGNTTVVIDGSGIVCTPAFPVVSFGGNNAVVTSCGASQVTVKSPAHAPGAVTVTLTNTGAGASNGLTYTYTDTTKPTFQSMTVSQNLVTVTFSEPVCRSIAWSNAGFATGSGDWSINNVSNPLANIADSGDTIPMCNAAFDNGVTTATIVLGTSVPNGSFVEVTLNETVAGGGVDTSIRDAAGNNASAPQARQATATAPETTPPTITSASGAVGQTTVVINFSEPVFCTGIGYDASDFTLSDGDPATTDPTVTGAGSDPCSTTQVTSDSSFNILVSFNLPADKTYTLTLTPEANEIQDIAGNDLATTSSVVFTTGAADFTPPTMVDARLVFNAGPSTDFVESGDSFSVTFSEKMNGSTTGTLSIQDQDGTTANINCAGGGNATCSWNTAVTTLTVTLNATLVVSCVPVTPCGTTPGMQIPFNITALTGITDTSTNPPNVLGSADRLVDYE